MCLPVDQVDELGELLVVSAPAGELHYVLTDKGRAEIFDDTDTCQCVWEFDANLVVCLACGTVYSTLARAALRGRSDAEYKR